MIFNSFIYPGRASMDRVKRRKSVSGYPSRTGVFRAWIEKGIKASIAFPNSICEGIEQAGLDLTPIKERLHQLIESQDQLQDIIVALWEEGQS